MLYKFIVKGDLMFIDGEDFEDIKKTLDYMGVEYSVTIVEQKMYAFHWHDYIDDEWSVIWCTPEHYESMIKEMDQYEVEYTVKEYN